MNITTWADSSFKIRGYLKSLGWNLISVEEASVINETAQYGQDVADMIERTRSNTAAIILGTFHTYKTN